MRTRLNTQTGWQDRQRSGVIPIYSPLPPPQFIKGGDNKFCECDVHSPWPIAPWCTQVQSARCPFLRHPESKERESHAHLLMGNGMILLFCSLVQGQSDTDTWLIPPMLSVITAHQIRLSVSVLCKSDQYMGIKEPDPVIPMLMHTVSHPPSVIVGVDGHPVWGLFLSGYSQPLVSTPLPLENSKVTCTVWRTNKKTTLQNTLLAVSIH